MENKLLGRVAWSVRCLRRTICIRFLLLLLNPASPLPRPPKEARSCGGWFVRASVKSKPKRLTLQVWGRLVCSREALVEKNGGKDEDSDDGIRYSKLEVKASAVNLEVIGEAIDERSKRDCRILH